MLHTLEMYEFAGGSAVVSSLYPHPPPRPRHHRRLAGPRSASHRPAQRAGHRANLPSLNGLYFEDSESFPETLFPGRLLAERS